MNRALNGCTEDFWPMFIKRHWKAFIIFIIGCIIALVAAVFVLFWFIETSTIGAMGTATIGEWTISLIWQFLFYLVLWELILVGIPAAISFGLGWYIFWKRLSTEENAEFKEREKKKHRDSSISSAFGFGMFIAFSIYVYLIGEINTPLGDKPYSYWVYTWFTALGWLLLIAGIPAIVILIIVYFTVWKKEN